MKALAAGLFLWFAAACWPQTLPAFHSGVELVAIPCSVVDSHGAPVHDLTREDFRVYDNGVRRVIRNLWLDSDVPLTIGVILDASESQREQLAEHRRTALALLDRLMRAGDRAFIVSVSQEVRLAADLSPSVADLRRQMEAGSGILLGTQCPARECGSSPLWNAIYDTTRLKLGRITGNKALLILTDGFDSGSPHTWRQAADEAERAETTVYAIQYQSKFGGHYAPDLYRLVEEAGGTWFPAPAGEYDAAVSRMETDLRHRYVLGVQPERLSGRLRHDIRVEVTRPDLTVRARKTYFLPE